LGFDFVSKEKVNVISTDINKKINIKKYFYKIDPELPFFNLFLDQEKKYYFFLFRTRL